MHTKPWDNSKEHDFFFIRFLSVLLKNHKVLKNNFLIDSIITQQSLNTITTFLKEKVDLIDYRCPHCKYNHYNLNEMWQRWNEEYETITKVDNKLSFWDYLSRKLHDTIKHTMVDKFIDLGFKYESSTQKIVVPIQLNSDIQPNYTCTKEMIELVQNDSNEYTKLSKLFYEY
ncbi:uncharacterized protein LOC126909963 [Daktulosphaira vitifoliae]|uniref:uncharacterized protein LOC126909963 n=1 Tax=Daktulosphaira vitifoliae TaxID=58002 RepID=UPI0021A9A0C9|nr:uncharacterized protein LOC126909963 [Daktulosphaira vitifoliae]